jgi:hypothetical protein
MMEGIEFDERETRVIYWNCRLRIIDQRIANQLSGYSGYDLLYRTELKKIRDLIERRVENEKRLVEEEINNSTDEKEHGFCLLKANEDNKNKDKETNKSVYLSCRKSLERKRISDNKERKFLNNEEFLKVENQKEEVEIDENKIEIRRGCIKYATDGEKLKECLIKLDKVYECVDMIPELVKVREYDDKVFCIKYVRELYPDVMAKYDENSKLLNVGPKISIDDLILLRDKEYLKCIRDRNAKISLYRDGLENDCYTKHLDF